MDFESATQWVKKNKAIILKHASKYIKFTPYSNEDFLSAAHQAAIITAIRIEGTDYPFDKYFWKCYDTVLSDFVPNPFTDPEKKRKNRHDNWSLSVPSDLCDYPEDITLVPDFPEESELIEHIAIIYNRIEPLLQKPQHKTCVRMLLGLEEELPGRCLTPGEVAAKIGCTRQGVTIFFDRFCKRIEDLVAEGTLDFNFVFCDDPEVSPRINNEEPKTSCKRAKRKKLPQVKAASS